MPTREVTFTVKLPLRNVWAFMIDRKEVGCLFPGCKGVELLNDLDSIWTIRMSLGPFTRTIEMHAHTTELIEYEKVAWTATHEHLMTTGITTLRKISDEETEITYLLEGHVNGSFSFLQDMVVADKLGEITRSFMKALKERLEYTTLHKS